MASALAAIKRAFRVSNQRLPAATAGPTVGASRSAWAPGKFTAVPCKPRRA
jgi:hypothetical protein